MSKALDRIAALLNTDRQYAREYCICIQLQLGGHVPSFTFIADFLTEHPDNKQNPYHVAKMILQMRADELESKNSWGGKELHPPIETESDEERIKRLVKDRGDWKTD